MIRNTAANSTYPKVAVQWLNQALYFYQSLCWLTVLCSETRPNAKPETVMHKRQKDNDTAN